MKVKRTSTTTTPTTTSNNVKPRTPGTPGRPPKHSSPKKETTTVTATSTRGKVKLEPSHPILFSQNSNSCSNDTNLSAASSSTLVGGTVQNQQALIHQKENKVRSLLKELQTLVKKCHQEKLRNEPNVTTITKTHERLRKEEKITKFQRNKLRSMYSVAMKESENEIKCLREALDCINQVRFTQNEIRILQQQLQHQPSSLLSSPTSVLLDNGVGGVGLHASLGPGAHEDTIKPSAVTTMRRGVLMSILQQAALTLPLWVGEIGQAAPALCGSMPPEPFYQCKIGDKVAALIKNSGGNTTITNTATTSNNSKAKNKKSAKNAAAAAAADVSMSAADAVEEEENWILAEVVAINPHTGRYEVDDVDAPEGQERHSLGKRRVVPLPLWRANPLTDPQAIFPKDSFVLALYPQTTCFYRGIVYEAPQSPQDDYQILFEDNTYPEGYSPPLSVPQLYVVADRSHKNK